MAWRDEQIPAWFVLSKRAGRDADRPSGCGIKAMVAPNSVVPDPLNCSFLSRCRLNSITDCQFFDWNLPARSGY